MPLEAPRRSAMLLPWQTSIRIRLVLRIKRFQIPSMPPRTRPVVRSIPLYLPMRCCRRPKIDPPLRGMPTQN
jgi:hypothetical protein